MSAKGIIAALIGVGLLIGGLGLWYVWARFTKMEERGVGLTLRAEPSKEERERMEKELNLVLDDDKLIDSLVADCDLVSFYEAASRDEAKAMARERSRVYFYTPKRLFIVHQAKRYRRGENDEIGKRLGELFREAAFGSQEPSASGGQ